LHPAEYAGFEATKDIQEADVEAEEENQSESEESLSSEENDENRKAKTLDIENIEDSINQSDQELDKTRGFVKYQRQKVIYRKPEERLKDWEEVTDYGAVRSNIRQQAARCMDCGIPFCQGNTGCPLGKKSLIIINRLFQEISYPNGMTTYSNLTGVKLWNSFFKLTISQNLPAEFVRHLVKARVVLELMLHQ
jgi:TolA-binding protein